MITGASGFIGTNLLQYFLDLGFLVINIDRNEPRNAKHYEYWEQVNFLDSIKLANAVRSFSPDYVVHLGARTDLNETEDIQGYNANIQGVTNLIDAINNTPHIKRVIFASSMLVCRFGHVPQHDNDYCPDTLYGQSKVITEEIIHLAKLDVEWLIVRPTSIWGPWFAEPYLNFFQMILAGRFVHPGKKAGNATFGYVGNTVYQIRSLLAAPRQDVNHKTFYLGDREPYNLSSWADNIAAVEGRKIFRCPYSLLKMVAICGDVLDILKIPFPLTSFRLAHMITDNVLDTSATQLLAPNSPFDQMEGIKASIDWIKKHGKV